LAPRFLVAGGARSDMSGALNHDNPSSDYVHAITDYATRMRADPRAYYAYYAYYGYYWLQVIYVLRGRSVILPVGYPTVRPVPVP
jgi:hypothetical protein